MNYIESACLKVAGFAQRYDFLVKVMTIQLKSTNTIRGYTFHLAKFCLHHGCLPETVSNSEYIDYYDFLLRANASRGQYKQTVYSIRFYFRTFSDLKKPYHSTPSIPRKDKKIPEVLSFQEIKAILRAADDIKVKSAIGVLYGCGLRRCELRSLELVSIDFDRSVVNVRNGKGEKDRCVPLSQQLAVVLKRYLSVYKPVRYLFEGMRPGNMVSIEWPNYILKATVKKAGIIKRVHCHTLRHSYATHMLEIGVSIVNLQHYLGHRDLSTTIKYLHLLPGLHSSQYSNPLDYLYPLTK